MGFGGIIAGALGGGAQAVGQIADTQIAQNQKMDMARMEQQLALERMQAQERIRQSGVLAENSGPIGEAKAAQVGRETAARVKSETTGLMSRYQQLTPLEVERQKQLDKGKVDTEIDATKRRGADSDYLKSERALADAKESSATRASAASSNYELGRKKAVDALRDKLSEARATPGMEDQAKVLEQQISALSGGGGKNFSDVASVMKTFENMAAAEEAPLKDPIAAAQMPDDEKKRRQANAREYRQMAATIGSDVSGKRGVNANPPKGGPQAGALPKIGDIVDGFRFMGGNPKDKSSWAPADKSGGGEIK